MSTRLSPISRVSMNKFGQIVAAVTCLWALSAGNSTAADAERGAKVFKKCASCHQVGANAKKRVGPILNNILAAKAAGHSDFKYSKALQKAADDGLHWSFETLDAFLENPKGFLPGTKMSFRGLKTAADRADVIAYLTTFSGDQMAAIVDEDFTVSEEVLSLVGDPEYGEYLASECTTCHQKTGSNDGIPGIIGWETEPFVTAMHAYREKHRDNQVMQLVAGRLNDEEIAALAAYFKGLED